jgi:hypothetical protein
MMRRLLRVAVYGVLLAGTASSPSAAELVRQGPAECPDASELSFRVERSVGMPLADAARLKLEVVLEHVASGYTARIRVIDADGSGTKERRLAATACEPLADAVSVALALALAAADPSSASHPASVGAGVERPGSLAASFDSAPPAAGASVVPLAPDAGVLPGAERAAPAAWRPSLSVWLLADAGSLPAPSLGAALGAEVAWRDLSLRALGTLLFEQHTELDSPLVPSPGADLELLTGSLLACSAPFGHLQDEVSALACLGLELGRLAGAGTGVPNARRGSALWLAPRLDFGAMWSIPRSALRLGASLSALAPLNRDEFELTDIGTLHQPPNVVGRLSFGVGLRFQ